MENQTTYLGFDIGTNSVGWAVSDENYHILNFKKRGVWGVRLFEEAKPAVERRIFRSNRRRKNRQKQRVAWLRAIFILLTTLIVVLVGCSSMKNATRGADPVLNFEPGDFEILGHITGNGESTVVFGFTKPVKDIGGIEYPNIIGINVFETMNHMNGTIFSMSSIDDAKVRALHEAIQKAPSADALLYPKFTVDHEWFFFGSKTKVTVRATAIRLKD